MNGSSVIVYNIVVSRVGTDAGEKHPASVQYVYGLHR